MGPGEEVVGEKREVWFGCGGLGLGGTNTLARLDHVSHDGRIRFGTIFGRIVICETRPGGVVSSFDGAEPRVPDREARGCVQVAH